MLLLLTAAMAGPPSYPVVVSATVGFGAGHLVIGDPMARAFAGGEGAALGASAAGWLMSRRGNHTHGDALVVAGLGAFALLRGLEVHHVALTMRATSSTMSSLSATTPSPPRLVACTSATSLVSDKSLSVRSTTSPGDSHARSTPPT